MKLTDPSITTRLISANEDGESHVYTYIHTYMEKRAIKDNTKRTNVTFYDGLDLSELKEICLRNGTNVSSIVSNLVREFNLLLKSTTPQKTLFNFDDETEPGISFDVENSDLRRILLGKSDEDFKVWEKKLQEINAITNQVYNSRHE